MLKNYESLAKDVLQSKKLSRINQGHIQKLIESLIKKQEFNKFRLLINQKDIKEIKKNKEYKKFIKNLKKFLHDTYSVYQVKSDNQKEAILDLINKTKDKETLIELHKKMLHTHASSRERQNNYKTVYKQIFEICEKPNNITDIGCGMNPFSLIFSGLTKINYIGLDFAEKDIQLINNYFKLTGKRLGFHGQARIYDIFNDQTEIKTDICFLFKMTDVIDYGSKGHKNTETFIKKIKSKYIIASFPTRTVSNKKMNNPRRNWFEVMLKRINKNFRTFETKNELFYVISDPQSR